VIIETGALGHSFFRWKAQAEPGFKLIKPSTGIASAYKFLTTNDIRKRRKGSTIPTVAHTPTM
jgi:hypothetical protein